MLQSQSIDRAAKCMAWKTLLSVKQCNKVDKWWPKQSQQMAVDAIATAMNHAFKLSLLHAYGTSALTNAHNGQFEKSNNRSLSGPSRFMCHPKVGLILQLLAIAQIRTLMNAPTHCFNTLSNTERFSNASSDRMSENVLHLCECNFGCKIKLCTAMKQY